MTIMVKGVRMPAERPGSPERPVVVPVLADEAEEEDAARDAGQAGRGDGPALGVVVEAEGLVDLVGREEPAGGVETDRSGHRHFTLHCSDTHSKAGTGISFAYTHTARGVTSNWCPTAAGDPSGLSTWPRPS